MLGLKHAFGTVFHPQSQGKVERMNQTVKTRLAKICDQTEMNWVDALPLALMSIRALVNLRTGHSPFKLQTGRVYPGPGNKLVGLPENLNPLSGRAYFNDLQALLAEFSTQTDASEDRGGDVNANASPTANWVRLRVISVSGQSQGGQVRSR